jgi:hypothetical protein
VGAGNASLLITGFFGLVKVVSFGFFLIFLVERIGRRWSLAGGAFAMGCFMLKYGTPTRLWRLLGKRVLEMA